MGFETPAYEFDFKIETHKYLVSYVIRQTVNHKFVQHFKNPMSDLKCV